MVKSMKGTVTISQQDALQGVLYTVKVYNIENPELYYSLVLDQREWDCLYEAMQEVEDTHE